MTLPLCVICTHAESKHADGACLDCIGVLHMHKYVSVRDIGDLAGAATATIRVLEKKVGIHEWSGYVGGLLVGIVLGSTRASVLTATYWMAFALALGCLVLVSLVRNYLVRRVAATVRRDVAEVAR